VGRALRIASTCTLLLAAGAVTGPIAQSTLGTGLMQGSNGCIAVDLNQVPDDGILAGVERCLTRSKSQLRFAGDRDPYQLRVYSDGVYGCIQLDRQVLRVGSCDRPTAARWSVIPRGRHLEIRTPVDGWQDDGCLVLEQNLLVLVPCGRTSWRWD
jgi:hypothetical protein